MKKRSFGLSGQPANTTITIRK